MSEARNDDRYKIPRAPGAEHRAAISRVLASGGAVRQVLNEHGMPPDPSSWQGRPGAEVATTLLTTALAIEGLSDRKRDKITGLAGQLAAAYGSDTGATPSGAEVVTASSQQQVSG